MRGKKQGKQPLQAAAAEDKEERKDDAVVVTAGTVATTVHEAIAAIRNPHIQVLTINLDEGFVSPFMEEFLEALLANTTLTSLTLENTNMGAEGLASTLNALGTQPSITHLAIHHHHVDHMQLEPLEALAALLSNNRPPIQHLDLSRNQLSDKALSLVLNSGLRHNTTVTRLNLAENQFGNEGTAALAVFLSRNPPLAELFIEGNHLSSVAISTIANMISYGRNTHLCFLNVESRKDLHYREALKIIARVLTANQPSAPSTPPVPNDWGGRPSLQSASSVPPAPPIPYAPPRVPPSAPTSAGPSPYEHYMRELKKTLEAPYPFPALPPVLSQITMDYADPRKSLPQEWDEWRKSASAPKRTAPAGGPAQAGPAPTSAGPKPTSARPKPTMTGPAPTRAGSKTSRPSGAGYFSKSRKSKDPASKYANDGGGPSPRDSGPDGGPDGGSPDNDGGGRLFHPPYTQPRVKKPGKNKVHPEKKDDGGGDGGPKKDKDPDQGGFDPGQTGCGPCRAS